MQIFDASKYIIYIFIVKRKNFFLASSIHFIPKKDNECSFCIIPLLEKYLHFYLVERKEFFIFIEFEEKKNKSLNLIFSVFDSLNKIKKKIY